MGNREAGYKLGVAGFKPDGAVGGSARIYQGIPSYPVVRACCLCEGHTSPGEWGRDVGRVPRVKTLGGRGYMGGNGEKKSTRGLIDSLVDFCFLDIVSFSKRVRRQGKMLTEGSFAFSVYRVGEWARLRD